MKRISAGVSAIVALVLVVAMLSFAVENLRQLRVAFFGQPFTSNLGWIIAGAALLGALCSVFLLAPGRVAVGWRNRSLVREQKHRELDSLRSESATRASWDEERTALTAENRRLQTQQDPAPAPTQQDPSAIPPDIGR